MPAETSAAVVGAGSGQADPDPRYKWIALSNTTLGMLMATINSSIVLIALPDIFRGIGINPLESSNTSYLLWMIMGFLVVTAVLVVGFGRLGDMFGRVRMYNMGFAIFAIASVFLGITWQQGDAAALWLIGWRIVQGIGGAFLMANSSAILTDAFPVRQRGTALGINGVAAIAGSFLGLVIGGLLGPVNWHLVFFVSVPFGVFGTIWAYLKLKDNGNRQPAKMDWWGNITFAVGLIAVLVGITYGIQPYGGHTMGWTSPMVLGCIIGGVVVLIAFGVIETKVAKPLFELSLFRNRPFTLGNLANLLASLGRGGLQFVLIIWLQGIWLPQHGYSFEQTPLWAGIYMLPLTIGFLIAAPLSGWLSDRSGAKLFTTGGMVISAVSFLLLELLPVDFDYWVFALILLLNGLGMGLFSSPNRAEIMNALPANARGAGAGMTATFQNSAMVLSIGFFFSLMIAGLSSHLPAVMESGLLQHGVPAAEASRIAALPPVGVLFAAFLGYNPVQELLGNVLNVIPPDQAAFLTGRSFFPNLISGPFSDGLTAAFWFAVIACLVAAVASAFTGKRVAPGAAHEPVGAELAAEGGELVDEQGLHGDVAAHSGAVAAAVRATGLVGAGASAPVEPGTPGSVVGALRTPHGTAIAQGIVTVTAPDGRQVGRTEVDPAGGYALFGLGTGTFMVVATAPGFRPEVAAVTLDGRGARQDFDLRGDGAVHGIVRSGSGPAGVPGVTVLALDAGGRLTGRAVTDPDGTFRMEGLPVGPTTITATLAGRAPQATSVHVVAEASVPVALAISAAGGLAGQVTGPDRRPLPNAMITVVDAEGTVVATATSGDDGGYRVPELMPGSYTVTTSVHLPGVARVDLTGSGTTTADVQLGAVGTPRRPRTAPLPIAGD
ncbi:MAG: major facilitator superfamily 1 [Pseudonocardia sp.]|nr:MFS transporter [Pseudonocardia sp.]MCU1627850.1 major facilitator superfamily 1 [Pseudonocardia sp.]